MSNANRTVRIGLIGLGTVGGGTARVILEHHDAYLDAFGVDLVIGRACALEPERARELGLPEGAFTRDWRKVAEDPDIDIVVELIGGEHPATDMIEAALEHGKHVVTANKALLGRNMERLARLAREHGVQLRCEASAGGGIPIVNALEHALVANDALAIAGILNGTTNYILTRMADEGSEFADVLADAQRLGYAEADPTADVDGFDAASKVAILASIAFRSRVTTDDVFMQGIRDISPADIEEAGRIGCTIKLLGIARRRDGGLDVRVHPAMVPATHMLAGVAGAMNAVYAVGDAVGETMFYGAGAGAFPTASAVVGDILALAGPLARGAAPEPEPEPFARVLPICPIDELETRYYLRLEDAAEAAAEDIAAAFAEAGVPVSSLAPRAASPRTLIVLTERAREDAVRRAIAAITAAGEARLGSLIRIEDVAAWAEGAKEN